MREVCSVFAIHYKYIVEVLEKTIRSTGLIDHSFEGNSMERNKNWRTDQVLQFSSHLYLKRFMIIVRHTHIIKKGEIYQKPKTLIVWVGET